MELLAEHCSKIVDEAELKIKCIEEELKQLQDSNLRLINTNNEQEVHLTKVQEEFKLLHDENLTLKSSLARSR